MGHNLILTTIRKIRKPEITTPFSKYSIDTHHLTILEVIEDILGLKYNPSMFKGVSQEYVKRIYFTVWSVPITKLPDFHKSFRLGFSELKNKVLTDQDYTLNLYMDLAVDLLGAIKSQLFYNPEHNQYRDFWIRELAPDIKKLHNQYRDFFKENDKRSKYHFYLYEVLDAALSYLSITELDADIPPTYQLLQELDDHDQGDIFDAYIDTRDFNNILSFPQIYCNLK